MVDDRKIIKSKERVRNSAEVFTRKEEVTAMLDLVKYLSENIGDTLLEPSCGDGNFMIEILTRKLETIRKSYKDKSNIKIINIEDVEFNIVLALASIYGIDISEENILEARQRILHEVKNFYSNNFNIKKASEGFWESINWVLKRNVIVGDMLNKIEEVVLVEYTSPKRHNFKRQEFKLMDQLKNKKENIRLFDVQIPLKNYKITHYSKIC